MQQKEVLLVVGVLVVGFFLFKGNVFSGRAMYASAENYLTEPEPYSGLGLGASTAACPPPTLLRKECREVGRWRPIEHGRNAPHPGPTCDDGARSRCATCVDGACDELRERCIAYCNPGYAPGQYGPWLCEPIVTCGTYGCFEFRYTISPDYCEYEGGAFASCACQDVRLPREE